MKTKRTNARDPKLRQQRKTNKKNNEAFDKNDAGSAAAFLTEQAPRVTNQGPIQGRKAIEQMKGLFARFLLASGAMLLPVTSYGQNINSVPYTITNPGNYFLNKNLVYAGSGVAISISASDVTVDFQNHTLSFSGASNKGTTGVLAGQSQTVQNVTIENGTVCGFESGISFLAGSDTTGLLSSGHIVEHMHIYSCSAQGIFLSRSSGCLIQNNTINNAKSFSSLFASNGYGIIIDGAGNHVVGNQFVFLFAGIYAEPGNISGGLANGNYFESNFESCCDTGVAGTFHDKIRFNTTVNCFFAITGATKLTDDNN